MKASVLACLLAVGLLFAASQSMAADADCVNTLSCFQESSAASRTLTVNADISEPVMMSCVASQCTRTQLRAQKPLNTEPVSLHDFSFGNDGQGFYRTGTAETTIHGFPRLPYNYFFPIDEMWEPADGIGPRLPSIDFTVAVTFYAVESGSHTLFSLWSEDEAVSGQSSLFRSFEALWDGVAGKLIVHTLQEQQSGSTWSLDVPWDTTLEVINNGVYPFIRDTIGDEEGPRLVSLYFRFEKDGKLTIDMATINRTAPEILISQIQDSGLYIPAYQPQTAAIGKDEAPYNWLPERYPNIEVLRTGDLLTQVAVFNKVLTNNELMGYHSHSMYFKADRSIPYVYLRWHDTEPCNSGNWMNIPPNEVVRTVCGFRAGKGSRP